MCLYTAQHSLQASKQASKHTCMCLYLYLALAFIGIRYVCLAIACLPAACCSRTHSRTSNKGKASQVKQTASQPARQPSSQAAKSSSITRTWTRLYAALLDTQCTGWLLTALRCKATRHDATRHSTTKQHTPGCVTDFLYACMYMYVYVWTSILSARMRRNEIFGTCTVTWLDSINQSDIFPKTVRTLV